MDGRAHMQCAVQVAHEGRQQQPWWDDGGDAVPDRRRRLCNRIWAGPCQAVFWHHPPPQQQGQEAGQVGAQELAQVVHQGAHGSQGRLGFELLALPRPAKWSALSTRFLAHGLNFCRTSWACTRVESRKVSPVLSIVRSNPQGTWSLYSKQVLEIQFNQSRVDETRANAARNRPHLQATAIGCLRWQVHVVL